MAVRTNTPRSKLSWRRKRYPDGAYASIKHADEIMLIGAQQIVGDKTRRPIDGVEMGNNRASWLVDGGSGVDALRGLAFDLKKYGPCDHVADYRA